MRNVASKHAQCEEAEENKMTAESNKWGSLPAINLQEKQGFRSDEEGEQDQNEDEGLQEVSFKR